MVVCRVDGAAMERGRLDDDPVFAGICDAAELAQAFYGAFEPVVPCIQVAYAGDHGGRLCHGCNHAERLDGVGCRRHVDGDAGKGALVFDHDPVVGIRDLAAHLLERIKEEPSPCTDSGLRP